MGQSLFIDGKRGGKDFIFLMEKLRGNIVMERILSHQNPLMDHPLSAHLLCWTFDRRRKVPESSIWITKIINVRPFQRQQHQPSTNQKTHLEASMSQNNGSYFKPNWDRITHPCFCVIDQSGPPFGVGGRSGSNAEAMPKLGSKLNVRFTVTLSIWLYSIDLVLPL